MKAVGTHNLVAILFLGAALGFSCSSEEVAEDNRDQAAVVANAKAQATEIAAATGASNEELNSGLGDATPEQEIPEGEATKVGLRLLDTAIAAEQLDGSVMSLSESKLFIATKNGISYYIDAGGSVTTVDIGWLSPDGIKAYAISEDNAWLVGDDFIARALSETEALREGTGTEPLGIDGRRGIRFSFSAAMLPQKESFKLLAITKTRAMFALGQDIYFTVSSGESHELRKAGMPSAVKDATVPGALSGGFSSTGKIWLWKSSIVFYLTEATTKNEDGTDRVETAWHKQLYEMQTEDSAQQTELFTTMTPTFSSDGFDSGSTIFARSGVKIYAPPVE